MGPGTVHLRLPKFLNNLIVTVSLLQMGSNDAFQVAAGISTFPWRPSSSSDEIHKHDMTWLMCSVV